ncbi:MAG: hypothetical protein GY898_17895, partial [Proteobacteria bacterium]|nr:hypothetical protein [Pseudomonadota bacterium]
MRLPEPESYTTRYVLLDPCAGDGEAIVGLSRAWAETFERRHHFQIV